MTGVDLVRTVDSIPPGFLVTLGIPSGPAEDALENRRWSSQTQVRLRKDPILPAH